jgi:hypothetical protein
MYVYELSLCCSIYVYVACCMNGLLYEHYVSCACMNTCICICVSVTYMHIHTYIHNVTYVYAKTHIYIYIYIYICTHTHILTDLYVGIQVYINMCICIIRLQTSKYAPCAQGLFTCICFMRAVPGHVFSLSCVF